jgi:diguanylate cyclase (GGDEF)-like protein
MNIDAVLLVIALFVQSLITATWWVGGVLLGLSRRSAKFWMFGAISNGMALTLIPLNGLAEIPGYLLLSNTLVVAGIISNRRGFQNFLKLSRTDTLHTVTGLSVCIFNLGICWPLGWQAAGQTFSSVVLVFLLLRTVQDNHMALSREFSPNLALTHNLLLVSSGIIFAGIACVSTIPEARQLWDANPISFSNATLLLLFIAICCLFAFTQGYMVVMRLVRKLQHLSHHDSLTGLLNRRAFEYLLGRECQRLQRFGEHFSLLILDIDHFKRINDRLGHAAGDAVLTAVAQTLQNHAREVDRVARFGGEEFCVLLPRTTDEGALQAAERFRTAINNTVVAWSDESISVTISTGLATALQSGESLEELLRRADLALYQAKTEGRNRVVLAPAVAESTATG